MWFLALCIFTRLFWRAGETLVKQPPRRLLLGPVSSFPIVVIVFHDDVIKWKHFPRHWPFVRGIHRWPVDSLRKTSDAELWCFLSSAPEQTFEQTIETTAIWDPLHPLWRHCKALVVCLTWLCYHILSPVTYISREHWNFVSITDVQPMVWANDGGIMACGSCSFVCTSHY